MHSYTEVSPMARSFRLVYKQTSPTHYLVINDVDGNVVAHIYHDSDGWGIKNLYLQTSCPTVGVRFSTVSELLAFHRTWDFLKKNAIGITPFAVRR